MAKPIWKLLRKKYSITEFGKFYTVIPMSKVSVVIPTYNDAQYMQEALDSVSSQTYTNVEILVIDDGSTDDTTKVLGPYIQKGRIRYIYQENRGPSAARNTGVRVAAGEYIAFLDADDFWTPSHLGQLLDAIQKYPQCSIAFSAIEIFGDAKDVKEKKLGFKNSVSRCLSAAFDKKENDIWLSNGKLVKDLLEWGFPFRCQASLIRKNLFFQYKLFFDEDIVYTEDAQFMTMAAYHTPVAYVDKVGVFVRRHSGNDGDLNYGMKIADSFELRVKKMKKFFHGKLQGEEKRALIKCLWSFQDAVMEERSKNIAIWKKLREAGKLVWRVPCFLSVKSSIKVLISK